MLKKGSFGGFDRDVTVEVGRADMEWIVCDFERDRRVEEGEESSLSVRLIGMGPEIPGHPFKADINVNFVLKS